MLDCRQRCVSTTPKTVLSREGTGSCGGPWFQKKEKEKITPSNSRVLPIDTFFFFSLAVLEDNDAFYRRLIFRCRCLLFRFQSQSLSLAIALSIFFVCLRAILSSDLCYR